MSTKIKNQLRNRKRRIAARLDKTKLEDSAPVLDGTNIHYELSERTRAIACGGIGMIHQMVTRLGLPKIINQSVPIFKLYLPYSESDHVLNIAYNIVAGGTCLDHLELRRNDEVYLDALGVQRIPDPTTAGDFCRRFDSSKLLGLMEAFNTVRERVWRQQPDSFFDHAIVDADGTMVETTGECKQGIDINHKGQWGYHPLLVSLANTGEPLYIVNRSGNRPSHEHAAEYLDRAVSLCQRAGFRKITLRGDTDFTQTSRLDGWHDEGVQFVFGIDATTALYALAEELELTAWKKLCRKSACRARRRVAIARPTSSSRSWRHVSSKTFGWLKSTSPNSGIVPATVPASTEWWWCGKIWMSIAAKASYLITTVASSTSLTISIARRNRLFTPPTSVATKRTRSNNTRTASTR